jgi:hypothetical protein
MADRNVKIADFDGDNMNILEWIQSVRMCAGATDWDDEGICERAKLHLTGKARTWLQNRIMAMTPGIDAWDPAVVNGVKPPNSQQLLTQRFLQAVTPTEQARLRLTLNQSENEDASTFFDRCEATQFALDASLPEGFRTGAGNKANYDIVRGQQILQNFINGLKPAARNHVTTLNVASADDALKAATAFEQANTKTGRVAAAKSTENDMVAKVAALWTRGGGQNRGRGGSSSSKDGCFYCGYLGHQIKECRSKTRDEANGIFQRQASNYQAGRVGTRGRGYGRGRGNQDRGRGGYSRGRGSYQGGNTAAYGDTAQQQNMPPGWEQSQPGTSSQQQSQPQYQPQYQTFVAQPSADSSQQAAFRYFPSN